jgi:hypothetical protein
MRFLFVISTFLTSFLLFSSCQKPSNASPIPIISFNSFQSTGANSGILRINFTDGDGDIGYPSQDPSAQPDLWVTFLYYDYASQKFISTDVNFMYNVPYLTPSGKDKSVSGIIETAMSPYYDKLYFSTLDSLHLEFQIYLLDRAGHKSNVITSREINPGTPNP